MNASLAIRTGAVWMALAIGLGAFGAHSLKARLSLLDSTGIWQTAVTYQAWQALGLVLLGAVTIGSQDRLLPTAGRITGWLLIAGSFLFSASLYALALHPSETWLGPVTPIGGLLMILGWLGFASLGGALKNHD
ncbi:MAG: DUF423 domain-containing protein [Planctomycetota bacterium]|nr:DUF423 domain-containing protein [Planctomycetota bacterium]MDG2142077.1 DUF423 domain-containing protein [Planctomycetota bacterium]